MEDPLSYLFNEIRGFFGCNSEKDSTGLIKVINTSIEFPLSNKIWSYHFGSKINIEELLMADEKSKFINHMKSLRFPLETLNLEKSRCVLSFNRLEIIKFVFHEILESKDYGKNLRIQKTPIKIAANDLDLENLNCYRIELVQNSLNKILELIDFLEKGSVTLLNVSGISSKSDTLSVKCGLVVEPQTKKISVLKTSEYLELRSTDMRLIAMHKYGLRIKDDIKFRKLIKKLGYSAVTVDLLEVKHTNPVQINRKGQGSTKGAAFILYNSARLDTILRGFEAGVKDGKYPKLPDLGNLDFSLLKEDDEWRLIFSYILPYPTLIKRCVNDLYQGSFPIHTVVQYLNRLVSVFSVYYRRTRILLQNRSHLIPIIHSRIALLKCLQYIVTESLRIFDIEPVQYM